MLGANVVVELNTESRARQPTSRAWAIIRRADRAHWLAAPGTTAPAAASTGPADYARGRTRDLLRTADDRLHPTNEPLRCPPQQPTGVRPRTGVRYCLGLKHVILHQLVSPNRLALAGGMPSPLGPQ